MLTFFEVTGSVIAAVWMHDGDIFDATFVKIVEGEQKKNAKHHTCRIQLLRDTQSKRYMTWVNNDLDPKPKAESSSVTWGNLEIAYSAFEEAFKTVSGLSWEDRHSKPQPDKFIFVTCKHKSTDSDLVNVHPGTKSTISVEACNALNVIISADNASQINKKLHTLSHNFTQMMGNVVERQRLEFGIILLNKLLDILGSRKNSRPGPYAAELGRLYREALYHPSQIDAGLDLRWAQRELESLKFLLNLTAAQEILKQAVQFPFDQAAQQLHRVLALKHITTGTSIQMISLLYTEMARWLTIPNSVEKFDGISNPGQLLREIRWRSSSKGQGKHHASLGSSIAAGSFD